MYLSHTDVAYDETGTTSLNFRDGIPRGLVHSPMCQYKRKDQATTENRESFAKCSTKPTIASTISGGEGASQKASRRINA